MKRIGPLVLTGILVGSLILVDHWSGFETDPDPVEVAFGVLAAGSTVGVNATNATASVLGSLISLSTDVLWLNNTNATAPWYARFDLVGSTGVANLALLEVGIHNGTLPQPQVTALLGVITQTSGAMVRLEPASANKIYVLQAVSTLGLQSELTLEVWSSQHQNLTSAVQTAAVLSVT